MNVDYYVEYPPESEYPCGVSQPPLTNPVQVEIPVGSSAFIVMENAVNVYGASYRFTATYYGSMGYLIEAINDVPYTVTNHPISRCFWKFIVRYPNGTAVAPDVGVSSFTFNTMGYSMIMSYQDGCSHPEPKLKKVKEEL